MAGPTMDTGQQVPYLQIFMIPYLLKFLCKAAYRTDSRLQKNVPCLHPREFLVLATLREMNSLHL